MQTMRFLSVMAVLALAAALARAELVTGEVACGPVSGPGAGVDMGPFDYRNPPPGKLQVVEAHHFTPRVASLKSGQSTATIGTDIDFTLRYFPNHHRALNAMARLAEREKTDRPRGSSHTVACWFDRAVRKAPDDAQARLLYGIWLAKQGEKSLAREQLQVVADAEYRSPSTTYNMGLAYFQIGDHDKALEAAHAAYAQGFSLPGLKGMLSKMGKWKEPVAPAAGAETAPRVESVGSESPR